MSEAMIKVLDIQRLSTEDGPGLRTTAFVKGCPLRCAWCHNPESYSLEPELLYRADKCTACGACAAVCPNTAVELSGKVMTVDEVMKVIDKDAKYYKSSKGGVTFSGGEASLHFELLKEIMERCKEKGYHTALETNGLIPRARLEALLPLTDLFLFDCKHTDSAAHEKWNTF